MFLEYEMGDRSLNKGALALKTKNVDILPFAVTGMGENRSDQRYYTKRQDSEQFLLLYTLSGEGFMEYEGRMNLLPPGSAMVIDCRKYQYYGTKTARWHFLWIHFVGKCAEDYVKILNAEGGRPLHIGNRISLQSYYEQMLSYETHFSQHSEMEIALVLQKLLTDLIHLREKDKFAILYDRYQKDVEGNVVYMREHFAENISVEQLAERCHLSKYYYIKMFKAYIGQSPYDYLINIRLQHAQKLLLGTEQTVEEIAIASGFSESKNFIACFKKKVGITPLQFRKQNRLA